MSAFWAQVIAAMVGAITTGAVRYLCGYLPRRSADRATGGIGSTAQEAEAE